MGQKTTNKLTEVSRKALDGAEACSAIGVSPQPHHSGRISEWGVQVKHGPVANASRRSTKGRERTFQAQSSRVSTRGAIANSALSD